MSIGLDAETGQGVALGSEVLLIGGASGVPDKQRAHGAPPGGWPDRASGGRRLGHRAAPDLPNRRSTSTSATASPPRDGIRYGTNRSVLGGPRRPDQKSPIAVRPSGTVRRRRDHLHSGPE